MAGDVGERGLEDAHDLLVDRLDHPRELAARVAHVVELLLQELVPLDQRLVLRQRERVDRAHEPQLALELARAGRQRRAVGDLGHRRRDRDVGLAVELAAHVLDRLLEPQPDLGFLDLEPARPARAARRAAARPSARSARSPSSLAPGGARRFRLLLAPAAQPVGERARPRRARSASRAASASTASRLCSSCARRARARASSSGRAASRASTSVRRAVSPERRSSTGGAADLELLAQLRPRARGPARPRRGSAASCSAAAASAARASSSASTAARTRASGGLAGSRDRACCVGDELARPGASSNAWRSSSDAARTSTARRSSAARAVSASSSCRRRRSRFGRDELGAARGGEPLARELDALGRGLARELGGVGLRDRVGERGGGDGRRAGRPGAPRARAAEAVALARHRDHDRGDASAMSSAAAQPSSTSTNGASSRVSSRSSAGCVERTHDASRRAPGGTRRQHRRAVGRRRRRAAAPTRRPPSRRATAARGRVVAVDDDRLQRVAERGGDRDLGAGVDLEVVGEPADHAVERRARRPPAACAVERERERLGAGPPARRVGRRRRATRRRPAARASSAARSARASSVSSGAIADARVDLGAQRGRGALDVVGLGAVRLERRAARRRPAASSARTCARSRSIASAARVGLVDVALRVGQLGLGRAPGARRGQLAGRERRTRCAARSSAARASAASASARSGASDSASSVDREQLLARARGFGDERLDDAFVGDRGQLALEPAPPFGDEVREPAAALAQRLGAGEQVGDVVVAGHGERVLGVEHRRRRARAAARARPVPRCASSPRASARRCSRVVQPLDLAAGEVQA